MNRSERKKHSFRPHIAAIIARRIRKQESLKAKDIIEEAGGGSFSTVFEELKKAKGMGESTENKNRELTAIVKRQEKDLLRAEKSLEDIVSRAEEVQKQFLWYIDTIRVLLKESRENGIFIPGTNIKEFREIIPGLKSSETRDAEGIWKQKYNEALQNMFVTDAKLREARRLLHENGITVDL